MGLSSREELISVADGGYILNAPPSALQGITATDGEGIIHLSKDDTPRNVHAAQITLGLQYAGATSEGGEFMLELVRTSGADPTGGTNLTVAKLRSGYGASAVDFAAHNKAGLTGGTFGASLLTVSCGAVQGSAHKETLYLYGTELLLAADEGLAVVMRGSGDAALNGWFRMEWLEAAWGL